MFLRQSRAGRGGSLRFQKAQDLAHDAVSLIRLKKILRMRRAIQNDEFLGLRCFVELGPVFREDAVRPRWHRREPR